VIVEVSEERGCLRNTDLVVHVSDKQSHFLIDVLTKFGTKRTRTMCTWVKDSKSASSQGPRIRYDIKHWYYCCWRKDFNLKISYDTKEDDELTVRYKTIP